MKGVHPTRMELLMLKKRRALAEKGRELLEEKRDALVMELRTLLEEVYRARSEVINALKKAFDALTEAKMIMGEVKLMSIAASIPSLISLDVEIRNIMGVRVPHFKVKELRTETQLPYNLLDTSVKLDEAANTFREVLRAVIKLAEVEASLRRIAEEIKKTKRRVNALRYIIIPRLENTIRYIELHLEEREREDFFRLKRIKYLLEKASATSLPSTSQ